MFKIITYNLIVGIITSQLTWTTLTMAQEATPASAQPPPAVDSWLSNGKELGPWWRKNAKALPSIPEPLLYHVEGTYNFLKSTGSIDMDIQKIDLDLYFRKGLITSETSYILDETSTEIKLQNALIERENYFYQQKFTMAITDQIAAAVGIVGDRNLTKFIDERTVYFGGLIYTPIDTSDLTINLVGAYAQTKIAYLMSEVPRSYKEDFPGVGDYESGTIYLVESLDWKINPIVSLTQKIRHFSYLDDTEFYNTNASIGFTFKLTETISLTTNYTVEIDKNSFSKTMTDYLAERIASGKTAGVMETTDTTMTIGIKFSF